MSGPDLLRLGVDDNVGKPGIRQASGVAVRSKWTLVPEGTT